MDPNAAGWYPAPKFTVWSLHQGLVEKTTYWNHWGSTGETFAFMVLHRLVGDGYLEVVTFDPLGDVPDRADDLLTDGDMLPWAGQGVLPDNAPADGVDPLGHSARDLVGSVDGREVTLRALEYAGLQMISNAGDGLRLGSVGTPARTNRTWDFVPIALEATGVETRGRTFRKIQPSFLPKFVN